MNDTGYIRKIDELGRIVIPKEVRKKLRINDGESLIISASEKNINLSKYSYIETNHKFIESVGDQTSFITGYNVIIVDTDRIIYSTNRFNDNLVSQIIKSYITARTSVSLSNLEINANEKISGNIHVEPIIANSLCMGLVIIYKNETDDFLSKTARLLANIISIHIDES